MQLYVALNCDDCRRVLKQITSQADINLVLVKPRKNLANADVKYFSKDRELPGIPVLVDGEKVIVGDAILKYLAQNPDTSKYLV